MGEEGISTQLIETPGSPNPAEGDVPSTVTPPDRNLAVNPDPQQETLPDSSSVAGALPDVQSTAGASAKPEEGVSPEDPAKIAERMLTAADTIRNKPGITPDAPDIISGIGYGVKLAISRGHHVDTDLVREVVDLAQGLENASPANDQELQQAVAEWGRFVRRQYAEAYSAAKDAGFDPLCQKIPGYAKDAEARRMAELTLLAGGRLNGDGAGLVGYSLPELLAASLGEYMPRLLFNPDASSKEKARRSLSEIAQHRAEAKG